MTKDFYQYKKLINLFRGQVLKRDFESKFMAATHSLTKSERFILKMELKRLAGPCMRLIDLRGFVDGNCKPYDHEERTHYLDDVAIRVFEENINAYDGYTFGVYEATTNTENNFRVIYQKEKKGTNLQYPLSAEYQKVLEKQQYPASLTSFGPYFNRVEERMNFAVPVQLTLENKQKTQAITSDLSVNGCKIRLNRDVVFSLGQTVALKLTGLEDEFKFDDTEILNYKIKNIVISDDIQLIGMQRVILQDSSRDGFKEFLERYIQGHKRRYKINLDNTISALESRHLETFVLPKITELPVFIEHSEQSLQPRYVLTCENNQNIYRYWKDEKQRSSLHFLLNPERLEHLVSYKKLNKSLLVYCFTHEKNGEKFFYSADEVQLQDDTALMTDFIGFAADKDSFAIFDLSLVYVDPAKAYSPLTVANSLPKQKQYLNTPPSEEVEGIIAGFSAIAVIENVSDSAIKDEYQSLPSQGMNATKLKPFSHSRSTAEVVVDSVRVHYRNQRQELRFHYVTPVKIESENVCWQGTTVDFSVSGLKIELHKSAILRKGDIVYLSFPKLQKITSSFSLVDLPYQVMRINKQKNIINLKVHVKNHQHIGRSFFRLLIEKNKHKLTADEYELMIPGLSMSLINLYASSVINPYLIIKMSGSRYKVESLACSGEHGDLLAVLKSLSDRKGYYNLYPLTNNLSIQTKMTSALRKMKPDEPPLYELLYISINDNIKNIEQGVTTRLATELQSSLVKRMFIKNALKKGRFLAIKVMMSRAEEPEIEFLNPELSYVSAYAIHRGKQLEQDIRSVIGTISLYDVTHEALLRHELLMD